eukprot:276968-Amphidinium_carterae.1
MPSLTFLQAFRLNIMIASIHPGNNRCNTLFRITKLVNFRRTTESVNIVTMESMFVLPFIKVLLTRSAALLPSHRLKVEWCSLLRSLAAKKASFCAPGNTWSQRSKLRATLVSKYQLNSSMPNPIYTDMLAFPVAFSPRQTTPQRDVKIGGTE